MFFVGIAYDPTSWYDATVKSNSVIGEAFAVGEQCCFRYLGTDEENRNIFELFDMRNTSKTITSLVAKAELISKRNSRGELYRSHDQGYINWRYSCMAKEITCLYEPNFVSYMVDKHTIVGVNPKSYIVEGAGRTRILKIEIGSRFFETKKEAEKTMVKEVERKIETLNCRLERLEKTRLEYLKS